MNKKLENYEILRDTAVYEYVANQQSAETRRDFEQELSDDPELRTAVESEHRLRTLLTSDSGDTKFLESQTAMGNFDALLDRIDGVNQSSDSMAKVVELHQPLEQQPSTPARSRWSCWEYSVAASIASITLASGLLFNDQQLNQPRYTALSQQPPSLAGINGDGTESSAQIDFGALVKQQKVATIVTAWQFSPTEAEKLLASYDLQLISGNAITNTLVVRTEAAFDNQALRTFSQDARIESIDIVSFAQD